MRSRARLRSSTLRSCRGVLLPPPSRLGLLALAGHLWGHGARLQPLAAALKALVHDAAGKVATAHDESRGNAVNQHISLIDREVQKRFAPIVIANENRRQLAP